MTDIREQKHRATEHFPVISLSRGDLTQFFTKAEVKSLSDEDMRQIADRWGDRLYEDFGLADGFSILGEIAKGFIADANKSSF